MNSKFLTQPLQALTRRVRWIRWLRRLHRFVWLLVSCFLLVFLTDSLFGLRPFGLRVTSLGLLTAALVVFAADWLHAWRTRLELVGLAHLLEKTHPELAERLVTLVQFQTHSEPAANEGFVQLLERETARQISTLNVAAVYPLQDLRRPWLKTAVGLLLLCAGLAFLLPLSHFTQRFFTAWVTPLVPYEIEVTQGAGFALRGQNHTIQAACRRVDPYAKEPTEILLIAEDATGRTTTVPMKAMPSGQFRGVLADLQASVRCQVRMEEVVSPSFAVELVPAPTFTGAPAVIVSPPPYLRQPPKKLEFPDPSQEELAILRFARMQFQFSLDRQPRKAHVQIKSLSPARPDEGKALPLAWHPDPFKGVCDQVAVSAGSFSAELFLELDHGLTVTLPVGRWTVYNDQPPRFTQPLRLQGQGGDAVPLAEKQVTISPDDLLRLQTAVEDDEGLEGVALEYRINDEPAQVQPWLDAAGKKQLTINAWLPLPKTLKQGDRFRFRVRASDNRRLKKGEVLAAQPAVPAQDMDPQVTIAPAPIAGEDRWIELHVDRSSKGFLKDQIQAQGDEVRDAVNKLKKRLEQEERELQKLQRASHQQAFLTPEQIQQAEKTQALNQQIVEELERVGKHFANTPELAGLAEHFFDLAETEMQKSAQALQRFGVKDLLASEREKELPNAQDAILKAKQKLERLLQWNKTLAEDRLDQWQLEKLAQRQKELAERLEKLQADPTLSKAERAEQLEAIRQEQVRIAEQMAAMQAQSQLLQESLSAMQQLRIKRLGQTAQELAQAQRDLEKLTSEKMPKDLADKASAGQVREKTSKLATELQNLAQKGGGPEAKTMAKEAAQTTELAKKAMQASQALKEKGDGEKAKMMAEDAAKKLELVAKQLDQFAKDQAMKQPTSDKAEQTALMLKESEKKMLLAEKNLPVAPKQAQEAMQGAAQSLEQASQQAKSQSAQRLPRPARNPASKAGDFPGAGSLSAPGVPLPWAEAAGKSWGELPGELKTQMLQDFRTRFGEDYAEVIQHYFERLAETPHSPGKK